MPMTLIARRGVLERKLATHEGIELWVVYVDRVAVEAILYPQLVGPGMPGARVMLNTTAAELGLPTGALPVVIALADIGGPLLPERVTGEDGRTLKLRGTPLQLRVLTVGEAASPHHVRMTATERLRGTPVVCLSGHEQLAAAAGGVKAVHAGLRVVLVMTDAGALPFFAGGQACRLADVRLVDADITTGQAFGGTLETPDLYTGLLAADAVVAAQVILIGPGPDVSRDAAPFSSAATGLAMAINAVAALDGHPIAAPRGDFSGADGQVGLDRDSLIALGRLALADAVLALPLLPPDQCELLRAQLDQDTLRRHTPHYADAAPGLDYCRENGIPLHAPGTTYAANPLSYQIAAAAGRLAAEMVHQ